MESVTGRVVSNGSPVPGAGVQFIPSDSVRHDPFTAVVATTTAEDGSFELAGLPAGLRIDIEIVLDGYARGRWRKVKAGQHGIVFPLIPGGQISGRIRYEGTGQPAANIGLMAVSNPPGYRHFARTDHNGRYVIANLTPGMYGVQVSASPDDPFPVTPDVMQGSKIRWAGSLESTPEWRAPTRMNVQVEEKATTADVDFGLIRGGTVSGRITMTGTDEPVPGVLVSARESGNTGVGSVSDADGNYTLRTVPGEYTIRFWPLNPNQYAGDFARTAEIEVVEDQAVSNVDHVLTRNTLALSIYAISPEGTPVAGAEILAFGRTGKDGRLVTFVNKKQQRLPLLAQHQGLRLKGSASAVPPFSEVTIPLEHYELTSVEGRVVDEGEKPLSAIPVYSLVTRRRGGGTGGVAALTDGDGAFTVDGLNLGDTNVRLWVQADGYQYTEVPVPAVAEATIRLDDIVLSRADRWIEGTVTYPDGTPVVGAEVNTYQGMELSGHRTVTTDAHGQYRMENLTRDVEPYIDVFEPDHLSSFRFKEVRTNRNNDFVIQRTDRFLAGKVVNSEGDPVEGAIVMSTSHGNRHCLCSQTATDENGAFRLEKLMHEREAFAVGMEGHYQEFENVRTNRDGVEFVMELEGSPEPE